MRYQTHVMLQDGTVEIFDLETGVASSYSLLNDLASMGSTYSFQDTVGNIRAYPVRFVKFIKMIPIEEDQLCY